LHPLLQRLTERKPENIDYLGVSYGLTPQLLRFWKRAGYVPLYIRQTQSELTGEHTVVMVRGLQSSTDDELGWLGEFSKDFRRRFLSLLSFKFREFNSIMGLSVLEAASVGVKYVDCDRTPVLTSQELSFLFTPFDIKRLESYAQNSLDYHVILDLLPTVALLYFEKRLGEGVRLSPIQSSLLLGMGLQRKSVEEVELELQLPVSQALALFVKLIRKISGNLQEIQKAAISATIPAPGPSSRDGAGATISLVADAERGLKTMEAELEAAGDEATATLREKQRAMIDSLDLLRYAIDDASTDWAGAEAQIRAAGNQGGKSTVVSVKTSGNVGQKRKADAAVEVPSAKAKKSRRSLARKQKH